MLLLDSLAQIFGVEFSGFSKVLVIAGAPVEHPSILVHSGINYVGVGPAILRLNVENLLADLNVRVEP